MKNNILWILLAVLVAAFVGSKFLNKKPKSSYDANFVKLNTEQVDKIVVHPKEGQGEQFTLTKSEEQWRVSTAQVDAAAMADPVDALLKTIGEMKAKRVVAKSEDKWPTYEVDEGKGKKIELFQSGKLAETIVLGRFDFNQEARTAKTFVRHKDDVNVYVVDGFLSMTLGQSADAFRNNEIVTIDESNLSQISLTKGGQSTLLRKENYWIDQENKLVDSVMMKTYLTGISKLTGRGFADGYSPGNGQQVAKMELTKTDGSAPIIVEAFQVSGGLEPFVISSSANPESYFSSDSAGVFKTLFLDLFGDE